MRILLMGFLFSLFSKSSDAQPIPKSIYDFKVKALDESVINFASFKGKKIFHLGGGHDHIYPLLMSLEKTQNYKHLKVLNLDAHLDTRTDEFAHSGTPFRQFAEATKVIVEVQTISPFETSNAKQAKCNALVALFTATACLHKNCLHKLSSNNGVFGP